MCIFFTRTELRPPDSLMGRTSITLSLLLYAYKNGGGRLCVGVCMCACECVGVYTLVSMLVCQGVHIHLYAHVSVCVLVCISMHVLMFHILYPSFRNITSMVGSITFHFNLLNIYDYGLWQERKREKGRQGEIVWTSECYLIVNIFKKHTWNVT